MLEADFIVRGTRVVLTCAGPAPRRGMAQDEAGPITGGAVASRRGTIVFVGSTGACERDVKPTIDAQVIDAAGCSLVPGFVDAHTHVVYAGDRGEELRQRLADATYAQIAAEGGGILDTVRATRAASEDELLAQTAVRLDQMLRCGTTTCEAKSGYGLETATELKMLRVIRRLDAGHPIDLAPTFLGAHEIPLEYRDHRRDYVDLLLTEMIPAVAAGRLAEWCDVFCERGVYTPAESHEILKAGKLAGLKPRVHADELSASGGSTVAARVGARSADHLLFVSSDGIRAMADAGVTATLLPGAAFYLKLGRYAPARELIAAGVPVALATDVNPGGGFSPSMPFVITLACFAMGLTFEEALVAATLNAAYALDRHASIGSLEPGKLMDAVLVQGDPIDLIRADAGVIAGVIKRGQIAFDPHGRPSGTPPSASSLPGELV